MEKLIIYGGFGFIGGNFAKCFPEKSEVLHKHAICSTAGKDALYLISTTNNYNIFDSHIVDIETNLTRLMMVLPNVPGTFNFVSSWFVYGNGYDSAQKAATEASYCDPKGFYSITKRTAEQLIESYCDTFNKNYRIMRLCNVIGGDSKAGKKKNALEYIIGRIINNEDIEIYDGDNYRNYLHVDDVCRAINLVSEKGVLNTTYNIGSAHSYRLIDIVQYVIDKTGSTSKIKIVETPHFHQIVQTKDFFMNCYKLRGLGFTEQYDIWETLDKIIYIRKNP